MATPGDPQRRAAALRGWAAAVWAVIVLLSLGRATLMGSARHHGCYDLYAGAGSHWLAGADLYAPGSDIFVYRYSPLAGCFFVPFAVLPDAPGSGLLRALNCGAFLFGLYRWGRTALPHRLTPAQLALLFLLAVPLAGHSLVDVQVNGLVVGLLLMCMAGVAEGRWDRAAVFLALVCLLKPYPLALALLLAAVHPRRFTLRFVAALLLCLALPFALQSPGYVLRQYELWVRWGLNERTAPLFQDLHLLAGVLGWRPGAADYLWLRVTSGAGLAALCLAGRWVGVPANRLYTTLFVLCCGWMMVLGPSTEGTTYIFFAPASAYLLLEAWLEQRSLVYRAVIVTAFAVFATAQLALWLPGWRRVHALAPYPAATLMMMAAVTAAEIRRLALWRSRREAAAPGDSLLRRAA
jgi:hypothetical protein